MSRPFFFSQWQLHSLTLFSEIFEAMLNILQTLARKGTVLKSAPLYNLRRMSGSNLLICKGGGLLEAKHEFSKKITSHDQIGMVTNLPFPRPRNSAPRLRPTVALGRGGSWWGRAAGGLRRRRTTRGRTGRPGRSGEGGGWGTEKIIIMGPSRAKNAI